MSLSILPKTTDVVVDEVSNVSGWLAGGGGAARQPGPPVAAGRHAHRETERAAGGRRGG